MVHALLLLLQMGWRKKNVQCMHATNIPFHVGPENCLLIPKASKAMMAPHHPGLGQGVWLAYPPFLQAFNTGMFGVNDEGIVVIRIIVLQSFLSRIPIILSSNFGGRCAHRIILDLSVVSISMNSSNFFCVSNCCNNSFQYSLATTITALKYYIFFSFHQKERGGK